jgi:hypothetical protein
MTEAPAQQQDGRADFDFLMGRWNVHHRCLRERLKDSTSWVEFEGTTVARKILGGLGNIDENILQRASGPVEAIAMRFFDPRSGQWSIYWADSVNGFQPPPVIGGFKDGRGEFYSQESFEGKSVFCRFIWSEMTANACRWEQAFAADGGKSWETNWIMEFTRQ